MELKGKKYPTGPYSVRLVFSDGSRLLVSEKIDDNSAIGLFNEYKASMGAMVGTTKRVELLFGDSDEALTGWCWKYQGTETFG
jgi:hypothetical protein